MIRLTIMAGTCAALAAGAIGYTEKPGEVVEALAPSGSGAHVAPMQSPAPQLAQQQRYGTVCEVPNGKVCVVAPQPINARCVCGQSVGRIVR